MTLAVFFQIFKNSPKQKQESLCPTVRRLAMRRNLIASMAVKQRQLMMIRVWGVGAAVRGIIRLDARGNCGMFLSFGCLAHKTSIVLFQSSVLFSSCYLNYHRCKIVSFLCVRISNAWGRAHMVVPASIHNACRHKDWNDWQLRCRCRHRWCRCYWYCSRG